MKDSMLLLGDVKISGSHALFLLLPIFDCQIHDIAIILESPERRELFGDTGNKRGCRIFNVRVAL